MKAAAATTRIKKSYSISREAEQFIRRVRKSRKIASDSEALDQILRESLEAQQREQLNAEVKAYYDEASDEQLKEEAEWAEFAGAAFMELAK
jgi:DNA-binding PadR family transcriptional regulator